MNNSIDLLGVTRAKTKIQALTHLTIAGTLRWRKVDNPEVKDYQETTFTTTYGNISIKCKHSERDDNGHLLVCHIVSIESDLVDFNPDEKELRDFWFLVQHQATLNKREEELIINHLEEKGHMFKG